MPKHLARSAPPERLGYPRGGDHRADRQVSGTEALGRDDQIGIDVEPAAGEPLANPAEPGDYLVGDEQHIMPAADLPDRAQVALGRRVDAACPDHRLAEECGPLGVPEGLDCLL